MNSTNAEHNIALRKLRLDGESQLPLHAKAAQAIRLLMARPECQNGIW